MFPLIIRNLILYVHHACFQNNRFSVIFRNIRITFKSRSKILSLNFFENQSNTFTKKKL